LSAVYFSCPEPAGARVLPELGAGNRRRRRRRLPPGSASRLPTAGAGRRQGHISGIDSAAAGGSRAITLAPPLDRLVGGTGSVGRALRSGRQHTILWSRLLTPWLRALPRPVQEYWTDSALR